MRRTVILAAGDFPKEGGSAYRLLQNAQRVVCCDGAANAYRRKFGKLPTAVIGDLDSLRDKRGEFKTIRIIDQDRNDLEKAVQYCEEQGWNDAIIVGATGKREDHTLGNIFRALTLKKEIVTDYGRLVPIMKSAKFSVRKGAAVSVFAPDPKTVMSSTGLKWPLKGVKFTNLYVATLNRTTAKTFTITTNKPVLVFIES